MRKRARVDTVQAPLVAHARSLGASWLSLAPLGDGAPDGLLGHRGASHLVEFKARNGLLTADQRQFIDTWQGSPVHICRTPEDIERLLFRINRLTSSRVSTPRLPGSR